MLLRAEAITMVFFGLNYGVITCSCSCFLACGVGSLLRVVVFFRLFVAETMGEGRPHPRLADIIVSEFCVITFDHLPI